MIYGIGWYEPRVRAHRLRAVYAASSSAEWRGRCVTNTLYLSRTYDTHIEVEAFLQAILREPIVLKSTQGVNTVIAWRAVTR